ncbi:D-glycerate dehydrogenase [Halobacteriovorax sp. GB3]|uniref:2-hydroxyacid dehydrogenase n=1 Tax=Halobacteriovorax sp. GB3 TaxID=2719615 RepID=UPI002361FF94|nr:D-glycerate dehydrogenase [Halobacteriovorax sp. GB3]MDD0852959.1 D-glycerate dehydrogenase [Halobacteriovorax sp. GB3]
MSNVLITKEIPSTAKNYLEEKGHKVKIACGFEDNKALLEEAKKVDALITMLSDKIDQDFLSHAKNLKVISNYAVGHNNIDSNFATKLGIAIGNTPDVLTNATAELAMTLLFAVARNAKSAMRNVSEGKWQGWEPMGFHGVELNAKTIGIVGAGRIGQAMAKMCHHGLNMNILYTARSKKTEFEKQTKAQHVDFENLLSQSDIVSVHCPLTEQTELLFNDWAFKKMKKGSIFINTARGEVHDEGALYDALKSAHLFGAGLDVTNPEPMSPNSKLLELDSAIIFPHIGSATVKAREEMALVCAKNVDLGLQNKPLVGDVNNIYS